VKPSAAILGPIGQSLDDAITWDWEQTHHAIRRTLAYLDEQAAAHPVPVCDYYCGQCEFYMTRVEARGHDCFPAPTPPLGEDKPSALTTMPRDYDHGMAPRAASGREPKSPGLLHGCGCQCAKCQPFWPVQLADRCKGLNDELREAQAELTRLKGDLGKLAGRPGQLETLEAREVDAVFARVRDLSADMIIERARIREGLEKARERRDVDVRKATDEADRSERKLRTAIEDCEHAVNGREAALTKLAEAERTIAGLQKVVEAARDIVESFDAGLVTSSGATISRMRAVLSALDTPPQPEPPSESVRFDGLLGCFTGVVAGMVGVCERCSRTYSDHSASLRQCPHVSAETPSEREIRVGSTWRFNGCFNGNPTPGMRIVHSVTADTVHAVYKDDDVSGTKWSRLDFLNLHTWISDPTSTAESETP